MENNNTTTRFGPGADDFFKSNPLRVIGLPLLKIVGLFVLAGLFFAWVADFDPFVILMFSPVIALMALIVAVGVGVTSLNGLLSYFFWYAPLRRKVRKGFIQVDFAPSRKSIVYNYLLVDLSSNAVFVNAKKFDLRFFKEIKVDGDNFTLIFKDPSLDEPRQQIQMAKGRALQEMERLGLFMREHKIWT